MVKWLSWTAGRLPTQRGHAPFPTLSCIPLSRSSKIGSLSIRDDRRWQIRRLGRGHAPALTTQQLFKLRFQIPQLPVHLTQTSERRRRAQPIFVIKRRDTGNYFSRRYIVTSGAFGSDDNIIANRQVAGDTSLPRENHATANMRAAGETNLGAQQTVFAYRARVPNLHQIIDFRAAPNA